VAAALGLGDIAAYDMTSACSGFVYGLATASGLIAAPLAETNSISPAKGIVDTVLLIGAEAFTTFVDPSDGSTRPLFGDGAGAVVLRRGEADELGALGCFDLGSDGARSDLLAIPAGGSRQCSASAGVGHADYEQAAARMSASAQRVLDRSQWSMEQVDWFIGHQANVHILQTVAFELGLDTEKVAVNIERLGNTLTASIPLLFNDLALRGDLKAGQHVLVSAFGAGLSWGSTVLRWPQLSTRDSEWND
jgi:3-oxoacyl-[acyl-carrier-protein] synthase-3